MSNRQRIFPLDLPASGEDSRFTIGLLMDVRDVLAHWGYPAEQMTGLDFMYLEGALFRFLYRPAVRDIGGDLR